MREIRIREMRYPDARARLEQELNDAFLAGELRVSVLHGIGMHTLKDMTAQVVRETGYGRIVEENFLSNPGVTLVDMFPPDESYLKSIMK